jgi:hypothetical protein
MRVPRLDRLALKVISVGLAALLWLLVSGEQIVERALRIPLQFSNLPAELELGHSRPERGAAWPTPVPSVGRRCAGAVRHRSDAGQPVQRADRV